MQAFKFISVLLIFVVIGFSAEAQYNIPEPEYPDYCSHAKAAAEMMKNYYSFQTMDPLEEKYDVKFYFLDLDVENNTTHIFGNTTIRAKVTAASLDTFAVELVPELTIDSVLLGGIPATFTRSGDMVYINLASSVAQNSEISAKIYYGGDAPSDAYFGGVTTAHNDQWNKDVTWSLSEPYAANYWFPVKSDLTDKADSCWCFFTTSSQNKVGSEGLLTNITNMPGGKLRYEWKSRYPIDYYLISFAVADYEDYSIYAHPAGMDDSLLIQNYIYNSPGYLAQNKNAIDGTVPTLELFANFFGPYPFPQEKYGHCISQFGGGMEHQTMTTLGGFGFEIIAHELGHMWFGDNITCATWSDIWINEGFATYADYLAHSYLAAPIYDSIWLKLRQDHVISKPGGSVYVPPSQLNDVSRIFDGRLSYDKGALILHMIRFELQNDSLFFAILHKYTEQYQYSTATGMDFKAVVENVSGMDFTGFFNQWYFGEGYPIYDINWLQSGDTLNVTSTQTSSSTVTPLFKMHMPYYLHFTDGTDTTILLYQDAHVNTYSINIGKTIDSIIVDPKQWVIHVLNSLYMGIEETSSPVFFTLGPNPASTRLGIFFPKAIRGNFQAGIMDLAGRLITKFSIKDENQFIDISTLPKGFYLLNVSDGKEFITKRFIKE